MSSNWIIGVVLILAGSIGDNLGNNLVSLYHHQVAQSEQESHNDGKELEKIPTEDIDEKSPSDSKEAKSGPGCCSWFVIGTTTFVIGNLCTFAAFGFGSQSLLASLESVKFVSNVIFASVVHNEPITWRMLISTAGIVGGNVLIVIFSHHESQLFKSEQLWYLYLSNVPYDVYLGVGFASWAACHYTYTVYYKSRVENKKLLWQHQFIEPFLFAVSSAIIGTQAVRLNIYLVSYMVIMR